MFKKLIYLTSILILSLAGRGWAKASNPSPPDGTIFPSTWASLGWQPGEYAVLYDIYFGENYDDVKDGTGGTFRGNQSTALFIVGFPGYLHPEGLIPETTYYWRIDENNNQYPDSPWTGDVWSFTIPHIKAYDPEPADGAEVIDPDVILSWQPGHRAKLHTVYYSDNFAAVSTASEGIPQGTTTYNPGILEFGKTYYWRVDEFDTVYTHKGDVWSFTVGAGVPPDFAGRTIYVDAVNGNDHNNGLTSRTAFATIQKGIDTASDGSTVLVAPGSYEENIIMKERVHLRGSGPSVTFISGEGQQLRSNLILWAVIWAADHSLLERFTITATPPDDSYNRYAVQGYTEDRNDPIIANNVFVGSSGNSLISFWGGSARIVNNTFFDNQLQHNLITVNNHRRSGIPVVANNIFANNEGRDIVGAVNGAQPEVSFNMLWDNRVGNDGFTGFNPGLGNKWENPRFIDSASGDLRLSPSSPAIDAGDNDAIVPFLPADMPGNSRIVNGIIDMGAYEYGAAPVSNVYYVNAVNGSDNNYGFTINTAFATIQKGIATAEDGDTVLVYPGLYIEEINFMGKTITVQGVVVSPAGAPVLWNPGDFAVSFYNGEGPDSILRNFIIKDSFMGIFIADSSPALINLTIVGNKSGIEAYAGSEPDIINTILWNNIECDLFGCRASYSCVERGGEGDITDDPLFVDSDNDDYHVRSERGRYWPEHDIWVLDKVTSPCIDAGDPSTGALNEPMPNGTRINIGAYGGTIEASLSPGEQPYSLPKKASNPYPPNEAIDIGRDVTLTWTTGHNAFSHNVYFGTEFDHVSPSNVNNVLVNHQIGTNFDPGRLYYNKTYYWRIDEVDSDGRITTGDVWTFTTIRSIKGRSCFTAETNVWINGAVLPISKVASGQSICGINTLDKIQEVQEHNGTFTCYDVLFESGNSIGVAENHYFLTESGQWISLKNLKTGIKLKTSKGSIRIISITKRQAPYVGKVYNLKVEGSDRYLVGKDAAIVRDY